MIKNLKTTTKKLSALCIVFVMLFSTFCAVYAENEEASAATVTNLSFVGTGMFQIDSPDNVIASANWAITTDDGSKGTDAYFQYDLSQLPQGEVITKATWKALFNDRDTPKRIMEFKGFKTTDVLGNFTKSYNDILAAGYSSPYTIREQGAISDSELVLNVSATDGDSTTTFPQWNIDMTTAVKNAVANEEKYLNFVVNAPAGYCYGSIPRYFSPQPTLVVETEKVASVSIKNTTDNKITAYDSIGFALSATVTEGATPFESVVLTVKDASNGDVKTFAGPYVNGNEYKWNFSAGLKEGTYTATVTATETSGKTTTAAVTIEVKSGTGSITQKSHLWALSGGGDGNYSMTSALMWFQHELPAIPEGAVVTAVKWYAPKKALNGNYTNGKFMFYKFNATEKKIGYTDTVTGFADVTETEPFATSDVVNNIIVKKTLNGMTDTEFAEVDITSAVKSAYANRDTYFGYAGKITDGSYLVSRYDDSYRPFIVVTYSMEDTSVASKLKNHSLTVEEGTATASVTVNDTELAPVLILAEYNGTQMVRVAVDDTVENNALVATLDNAGGEGITYKSFVWSSLSEISPLLPIITK